MTPIIIPARASTPTTAPAMTPALDEPLEDLSSPLGEAVLVEEIVEGGSSTNFKGMALIKAESASV